MVFGETLTYTNTVRGALVSYKQRDMGAGGRGTHIWHVPLAESVEAAQRVLQPPRAAGAARRQAPGAAAAVRRAALAAPSAAGGRNRPCRTPDRAISKKFRQSSDRGAEFSARERLEEAFRSINIEDFHDLWMWMCMWIWMWISTIT